MNDRLFIVSTVSGSFRFVVMLFNGLQTFGSLFCYDIPSALQDMFQGVGKGRQLPTGRIDHYLLILCVISLLLSSERVLSQCNGGRWVTGVCPGLGHDPAAVQPPFYRPFVGVSCHPQLATTSCLASGPLTHFFGLPPQECSGDARGWIPH